MATFGEVPTPTFDPSTWQNAGNMSTDLGSTAANMDSYNGMAQYGGTPSSSFTGPKSFGDMSAAGKMGVIGQGVSAFGTLASLYLGFKAMGAQKKQFKFQKGAWEKNYANSLKDCSNQLRDNHELKASGNAFFGRDYQSLDSYMADRQLGG